MLRLMIQAIKGAAIAVLAIAIIVAVHWSYVHLNHTSARSGNDTVIVVVQQQDTMDSLARQLKADGLIRSTSIFSVEARITLHGTLQPGQYTLHRGMDLDQILAVLGASNATPVS